MQALPFTMARLILVLLQSPDKRKKQPDEIQAPQRTGNAAALFLVPEREEMKT
jgi:hypothetical protein